MRLRRHVILVSLAILASVAPALAQPFTLSYPTQPNGGSAGPRGDRTLIPFSVVVNDGNAANFPAAIAFARQDGNPIPGIAAAFLYPTANTTLDTIGAPVPNVLFEGRNQVLGRAGNNTGAGPLFSNVPATYLSLLPIFIDCNTGPPDNPQVLSLVSPGIVSQSTPFRARVTFNQSIAAPRTLSVAGSVVNVPTVLGFAAAGEVGATVTAAITPIQFSGSIVPLTSPVTTSTGPFTVPFVVPIVPAGPQVAGQYALDTLDFTNVVDGIYRVSMTARDVANATSPPTTATEITVDIDRRAPVLTLTFPQRIPLIIDGPTPPVGVTPDQFTFTGVASDERAQGTTVTVAVITTSVAQVFGTTVASQVGNGIFGLGLDFRPGQGIVPPTTPPQDIYRIEAQARDLAGNLSNVVATYVIRDATAPLQPVISFPPPGQGVTGPLINIAGLISNQRVGAGEQVLEEHGDVRIRVLIESLVNPSITAQVEVAALPSSATHDSDLDDFPGFSVPTLDILGQLPNQFTFTLPFDVSAFPQGGLRLTAFSVDGVGNVSAPAAPISFTLGREGPQVSVDFAASGPDDNSQLLGTRTNQLGSDDGDTDGIPGFFVSLKSPEVFDAGNPPSTPRPPVFSGNPDPGSANVLVLSGQANDVSTPVATVTATGPSIPTTTLTVVAPATQVSFSLSVDIRNVPEGIPVQIDVRATNTDGTQGPSFPVVLFRDVRPPVPPRITSPQLLDIPFGTGILRSFFAGNTGVEIVGQSEPNALVVLSTPITTGTISPPVPPTSPTQIPNRFSALASFPPGAQFAQADATGLFRFPSVDLSRVALSATTPVPIIIQAVDSFDNTDPVLSAAVVGVFRLDGAGEVVRVRLDPGLRNQVVFPNPPVTPVVGQFFARERILVELQYSTVLASAPELTVRQTGGVDRVARRVAPASPEPLTTSIITYEFRPADEAATFDGPVLISTRGGRDVFGFIPNAFSLARAFFVDSTAPALATTSAGAFAPTTGAALSAITSVAVTVFDPPSGNGSAEASCISSLFSALRLRGPLERVPIPEVVLMEPAPIFPGQPVTVPCPSVTLRRVPVSPPTSEGTYEFIAEVGDNVGNVNRFSSIFRLDRTPIPAAFIECDPRDQSTVSTLPRFAGRQSVFVTVDDTTFDRRLSQVRLFNPVDVSLGTTPVATGTSTLAVPLATPLPGAGASDGTYRIVSDIVDAAGNRTPTTTCSFILDTLPPFILSAFPPDRGCARAPLTEIHAELADTVPNNSFPPAFSGVHLEASSMSLRLLVPDPLNPRRVGAPVTGVLRYRTSTGPFDILALEFTDAQGRTRTLASDGTEDGRYGITILAADQAGNRTTATAQFDYDSQNPRPTLTDFPEGSFLADSVVVMAGTAFDVGPCGLIPGATAGTLSTSTVQVSIRNVDAQGRDVLPVVAPYFDFRNATSVVRKTSPASSVKDELDWAFTTAIPAAPGRARVLVRAVDMAGNVGTITREITIQQGTLVPPRLIFPADGSAIQDKAVTFRWLPVTQAKIYDLEVTRLTPAGVSPVTTLFPAIPFPRNEFGIVDLTDIANAVSGGRPITAASTFSWRMRSSDVSLNSGAFSLPSTFVVDPTPPTVFLTTFVPGSVGPIQIVTAGPLALTVDFTEDDAMDPGSPIEVFLQPRDLTIPPILITQTSFTALQWRGRVTLPPAGETRDVNGRATLVVRRARNRAGREIAETRIPVDVDVGPFFAVRFFSNPMVPEELEIVIKATPHSGTDSPLRLIDAPVATITQHGHLAPTPLVVRAIPGVTVPLSAFRTFFRVDRNLLGFLDFEVTGTDVSRQTARRRFGVSVVQELARTGVGFALVAARHRASAPSGALGGGTLITVPEDVGPPDVVARAKERLASRGLELVDCLGYMFPDATELAAPVEFRADAPAALLAAGVRPSQIGLYACGPGAEPAYMSRSSSTPTTGQPQDVVGSTRRLGYVVMAVDRAVPTVELAPDGSPPDAPVHVTDRGSGVDPERVTLVVDGQDEPTVFDAATGQATLAAAARLAAGIHQVQVRASDFAGNVVVSQSSRMVVEGPLSVRQAVCVPNPVRGPLARLRYVLTRAGSHAKVAIHDVSGRRVTTLDGPAMAGANTIDWALDDRGGSPVASGVYFFTLDVTGLGAERVRSRGKIAVLR